MKTLILARHGKAEEGSFQLLDFDRKLTNRGKDDVQRVSEELKSILKIDLIISSPAKRAFQTAKIFAKIFEIPKDEILKVEKMYEATMANLLQVICSINTKYNTVLLTGHNPSLETAISYLCSENILQLPTSGLGIIEFPFNDWSLVSAETGKLKAMILP